MENIQGIYILNKDGTPLFTIEYHAMGSGNEDYVLLSNFLSAFQSFTSEIDEVHQKIKALDFAQSKILFCEYKDARIKFVLKCAKEIKIKKAKDILTKIENLFLNTFLGYLNAPDEARGPKLKEFHEELLKMIENKKSTVKVENFLGTLS